MQWCVQILQQQGIWREDNQGEWCSPAPAFLQYLNIDAAQVSDPAYRVLATRQLLSKPVSAALVWPAGSVTPLMVNVRWLARVLKLQACEMNLLVFCVLVKNHPHLASAIEWLGTIDRRRLSGMLAQWLGSSLHDVRVALSSAGRLCETGLLESRGDTNQTFEEHFQLFRGLEDALLMPCSPKWKMLQGLVIEPFASGVSPRLGHFDDIQAEFDTAQAYLRQARSQGRTAVNVLVHGPRGAGKSELAHLLVQGMGARAYALCGGSAGGVRGNSGEDLQRTYALAQAVLPVLDNAVLVVDEADNMGGFTRNDPLEEKLFGSMPDPKKHRVRECMQVNATPTLWLTENFARVNPSSLSCFDLLIELKQPPLSVRQRVVHERTGHLGLSEQARTQLVANEQISLAHVAKTSEVASQLGVAEVKASIESLFKQLNDSIARTHQSRTDIDRVVSKTGLPYRMDVINTSMDVVTLLNGLRSHPHARLVFHGASGTGKSAFAKEVAQLLGREVMLRRGSDLIRPFVGETESNIAEMFAEAKSKDVVLILDEADSFLSARKGAQNRWEITDVNEMLQQMEDFDGIFIATTNLLGHMDAACMRRFDAKIEFKPLKEEQVKSMIGECCTLLGMAFPRSGLSGLQLDLLTPGDFNTVLRQNRLLPILDFGDLCSRLRAESAHRSGPNPIGFLAAASV